MRRPALLACGVIGQPLVDVAAVAVVLDVLALDERLKAQKVLTHSRARFGL